MMLHKLPREIILEILIRLPFEYMIQSKEVCKTWQNLLRHIKCDQKIKLLFAGKQEEDDGMQLYYGEYDEKNNKNHGEQLSFDVLTPLIGCPPFSFNARTSLTGGTYYYREDDRPIYRPMVGSVRGLVCFYETHDNVYDPTYICNLFTKELVLLPRLYIRKDSKTDFLVSGFGYLYATNEYKVVRIHYSPIRFMCEGRVEVYTLGDKNGWRKLKSTNLSLSATNGILCDGALHWLDTESKIVAFDLEDEEFRSVPSLSCFKTEWPEPKPQLLLFRGHLSVVLRRNSSEKSPEKITIWSLKEDDEKTSGHKEWRKEFSIRSNLFFAPSYYPLALTEDSQVLLWHREGGTLIHYDPETAISKKNMDVRRFYGFQAIPYMKSDVSFAVLAPDQPVVHWE